MPTTGKEGADSETFEVSETSKVCAGAVIGRAVSSAAIGAAGASLAMADAGEESSGTRGRGGGT